MKLAHAQYNCSRARHDTEPNHANITCARELTTRALVNRINSFKLNPTLAYAHAPYTLTADAILIQITIIPVNPRLSGIQHTLLI